MGNFLVVISEERLSGRACELFRTGIEISRFAKGQTAEPALESSWFHAAAFRRRQGPDTPALVSDPVSRNWLLATGTWFHESGYAMGEETRLLERYAEVGADRLTRELEGFFLIVIGDSRTRETIVITDVVGSCHGFIRNCDGIMALSGSSFVLAAMENADADPVGVQEFLNTGIIYEDRTLYKQVKKLEPATLLRFAGGRLQHTKRYWNIRDLGADSIEAAKAPGVLAEKLSTAATRIGRRFAKPVCDLTGGYDSRSILSAFLMAGVPFSTTVSGPVDSADVLVSKGLAAMLGLEHLHVQPTGPLSIDEIKHAFQYTDGEYDIVDYARILRVHLVLSDRFDVSVNGSFGEVARGYWWELLWPRAGARGPMSGENVARLRYAAQQYDPTLYSADLRLDMVSHLTDVFDRTNSGLSDLPNTMQMDHAYLRMRMHRWQGRIGSSTDQLWPCVPPFMFRSVLETMLQSPTSLRRRSLLIRRMLAEFAPNLANYPLEHGQPALPVRITNLHRFAPLLGHYGQKVVSRLKRNLHVKASRVSADRVQLPVRVQLWQHEEVRDLLLRDTHRIGNLVDKGPLTAFLDRSQTIAFDFNDQWCRLLSLEYTLETLHKTHRSATYS